MSQINRIKGGQIDRSKTLKFNFDAREYQGHPGDTLASALLANGVRLMGRSFKYHRPRGPLTAGSEEPNAIVTLRGGARAEPNTRATSVELYNGLWARSQNSLGSLKFDLMAVNDVFSDFLTAGFYYKTFMWPAAFWEKVYEPIIRKAAGLGALSEKADPDSYDKGYLHCELLIIGAGPAGLMAALTAARSGADVILADEDFRMGGRLNSETLEVGGTSGADWAAATVAELSNMPNVRLMPRTTVIGAFDHSVFGAVEQISDHLHRPDEGKPRQILWRIYSAKSLLCAGATERPIAFQNNDRPGIMLGSAIRSYVNRFAATPANCVSVFTNSDEGHQTARDLHAKGIKIAAVIDTREAAPQSDDYQVLAGARVTNTKGRLGLTRVEVENA
ncbi:MAG: 2Fe-2S iron-sulfur cluster-binding protein, partial [Roseobacter sp.]